MTMIDAPRKAGITHSPGLTLITDSGYRYACTRCGRRHGALRELVGKDRVIDFKVCSDCETRKPTEREQRIYAMIGTLGRGAR